MSCSLAEVLGSPLCRAHALSTFPKRDLAHEALSSPVSNFLFFFLSRRLGAELGKSVVYQETNGGKRSPRCSQTCFGVILGLQTVRPVR